VQSVLDHLAVLNIYIIINFKLENNLIQTNNKFISSRCLLTCHQAQLNSKLLAFINALLLMSIASRLKRLKMKVSHTHHLSPVAKSCILTFVSTDKKVDLFPGGVKAHHS